MAGPERIHEWLAESTLAFTAATEFPFGRTTLHDLTLDEDEDFLPSSLGSDDDEDDMDMPISAATLGIPGSLGPGGDGGLLGARHRDPGGTLPGDGAGEPGEGKGEGVKRRLGPVLATDRPFLYSGRLMLVALPGLALAVSVAGDLLITILNIGAMLVYLLHVAGVKKRALVAYIITFGCCQIIVIYSALPLLWHTPLNVFLIGLLNSFTILTGAWGLLFFDYFRTSEPDLTRLIETCLFGLYPAINVILVTWIIGSGISPAVAPYGLIAIGFMVLQLFMTPTPSSFNKPSPKDAEIVYVLDSAAVGAMALAYAALPPGVYTYLTVVRAHQPLLSPYFMVELVFLSCLSTFLATLMNLREFLEVAGLEYKYLQRIRWAFGLTALLLLSAVLHKYGFSFYLLPWLTLGLALHTGHGFFSRRRQFRTKSAAAALVLLCLYSFIFGKLPWKLQLYLTGSGVHINTVQTLLFVNALLCVACVYASTNSGTTVLGWLVTLQTVGLVGAEKLLWAGHHYLTSLLVLSAISAIYFILRLFHAKKLSWEAACLCIAVHLTKLTNCCDAVVHRGAESVESALYEDITSLLLGLLFTRALLFDKGTITFKKWLSYMVGGIVLLSLAMPALLYKSFIVIFGSDPTFSDLTALGLLLAAGLSIKLSLQGDDVHSWQGLSHVGPTAVVMSVVLFHLKPEPILNWEEGNKWLVIVNLVSCFLLVPMAALSKSSLVLTLIGLALGLPLGVSAAVWMLPGEVSAVGLLLSGMLAAALTCIGLFVWRQVAALEAKLRTGLILVVLVNVGLFALDDDADVTDSGMPSHFLLAATASSTIIALLLKLHSQRENHIDLTAINPPVNGLALMGNTCATLSYLLLCVSCPTKLWELWYIITSSALLLLQRDHLLLAQLSRRNSAAPLGVITSLVLWVSTQWNSLAWAGLSIALTLTGIIELILVYATVPLYIIYFTVLWQNRFYISDRLVVFVTPVNAFLFVFGSSFQAWAFAVYGIGIGIWLIKYKLPLRTDVT